MRLRHLAAVLTGLAIAAGIGLLAGSVDPDQFWQRAVVFAVCTVGPAYGAGWLVFLSGRTGPRPPVHAEETVEHDWWNRSAANSFLDLLAVTGLAMAVLSVLDLQVDARDVLAGLILLAFGDVVVRLAVLRRRTA